jgi:tRNA (mo5U34)-methyltransferase
LDSYLDYSACFECLAQTPLAPVLPHLRARAAATLEPARNGHFQTWLGTLHALAQWPAAADVDLNTAAVRAGHGGAYTPQIQALLESLHPWRKGPYEIEGVLIDTEWRSDWKWDRLAPHIHSLHGRRVLDVGCGSGYHCWRMAGAGADLVLGIDPFLLAVFQFHAIKHFLGAHWPVWVLPLGIEDLPLGLQAFDTVFSMGVLYHRRSPLDHLLDLHGCLRAGGELVLETLVLDNNEPGQILLPPGRYARMRNVWFIPSCAELQNWLTRCGFRAVRCVDVSPTTPAEQRRTPWMRFESLSECLDPQDPTRTVEGHPAPVRALFIATKL